MPEHPDRLSDGALVRRIATGDRAAFAELFRRRQGNVYRFALHMTGQPAVADDVTQEVFLAVLRDAGRYRPDGASVTAWLCGIARNHTLRRLAAEQRAVPLEEEHEGRPAPFADPVENLARAEAAGAVRAAVLALPVAYREAVALCDLQEMPYADAAEVLGCAIGTVRSRLARGRSILGGMLAARDGKRWIA